MDRRHVLRGVMAAGFAAGGLSRASARGSVDDPLSGAALFASVRDYERLGEHRTATRADNGTSLWLQRRLAAAGFDVRLEPFTFALFEPKHCAVAFAHGAAVAAFPAWPVVETPEKGLNAPLVPHDARELAGRIAVVTLPYKPYATWAQPDFGDPVATAIAGGAAAVVAITEGPTQDLIALNAASDRCDWRVPVVLAAGHDGERLRGAAARGERATLFLHGRSDPKAQATNVVARRSGRGKTIVLSTPKSGWFTCAGERGSGVAIFLGLAEWLARRCDAEILCIATSGHEIDGLGLQTFLAGAPPPPAEVCAWLHIGANVACRDVHFERSQAQAGTGPAMPRGIMASSDLMDAVARAFRGQKGYDTPLAAEAGKAVGEAIFLLKAGYRPLISLVGSNALFHTRLDRAALATDPQLLEPVATALSEALNGVI